MKCVLGEKLWCFLTTEMTFTCFYSFDVSLIIPDGA